MLVTWLAPWSTGNGVVEPTSSATETVPSAPAQLSFSLPPAEQGDLFVSPAGDDAAAGGREAPLATIDVALERVKAGHTVWLASGTYPGFAIKRSGDPGRPITIAGQSGDVPSIQPTGGGPTIDLSNVHDIALVNLNVSGPERSEGTAVYLDGSERISVTGSQIAHTRRGFGIEVRFSADVDIDDNDLADNAVGIRLYAEGNSSSVDGVVISRNRIHDSNSMIVNDERPDNDWGANAIVWHKVTGRTFATDNQIWSNHAESHDYGTDGGAFEIWGSSNLTISGNTAWNNENVLETGTDGQACDNITFVRNTAYVTTTGVGLILRCATNSLVAHNVFDGVRDYAFELSDRSMGNQFATSIEGLRIIDNIIANGLAYLVRIDLPESVEIDYNLFWGPRGTPVAKLPGNRFIPTIAGVASVLDRDHHSVQGDPRFVDQANRDYRLLDGSPGIDSGTILAPGEAFLGAAPDIGAYEGGVLAASPS